jgi:membrane protein CcdC involved in cytochrome C biogenesis
MQVHQVHQGWLSYVIPAVIVVIVLSLRLRRMGKVRPLKLETLWVVPVLYLAVAALMFWQLPPTGSVAIACVAALFIGAAVGWQRGRMMHIHVDPETHALNQKASPAARFFLIAIILVRSVARSVIGQEGSVSPAMLSDPLVAFALGMFTLTRVEMYLRAKRLLTEVGARS